MILIAVVAGVMIMEISRIANHMRMVDFTIGESTAAKHIYIIIYVLFILIILSELIHIFILLFFTHLASSTQMLRA